MDFIWHREILISLINSYQVTGWPFYQLYFHGCVWDLLHPGTVGVGIEAANINSTDEWQD